MKHPQIAVLLPLLFLTTSFQWQRDEAGNFEAWDDSNTLKVEVSHPAWKYMKNYVDNYQNPALVIDSAQGNQVTAKVTVMGSHQVDWLYLYWGGWRWHLCVRWSVLFPYLR